MNRDELIDRMARAADMGRPRADVCLHVMCSALPGLADVLAGEAVIVPKIRLTIESRRATY